MLTHSATTASLFNLEDLHLHTGGVPPEPTAALRYGMFCEWTKEDNFIVWLRNKKLFGTRTKCEESTEKGIHSFLIVMYVRIK